ncbi:FAD-dependent monooxygenase [Actinocrispum wychmicini]|uniref:2-polyprenyl-6-methoxyphenol hydroxylase-like FAD-dependent oxidoreductase n=1 Tax=Actinocrispum wychmicini TaxID=1213861 RepID=A0A4R2K7N4_9PSEU|nr:FAD-dependent monooxygenase [Actinocrispum wychmicini]TCO65838.1 2-polyprenyl-6-methoxyphenol hydroxylase-like FAD-dependent oxidoreductase [Actinocrispum wychmicini]
MTILIVGGGPNGLMLACELRLSGVPAIVLEQLPERSNQPKANGMVGQVVRLMDHRGLHERVGAPVPMRVPRFMFGALPLELDRLADNPITILPVPQRRLEQMLEERALELGAEIRRGHEVISFEQDETQVVVQVRGPEGEYEMRTPFLVGADGAASVVRKEAGIDFPGVTNVDTVTRSAHVSLPDGAVVDGALDVPGFGRIGNTAFTRTERGVFVYSQFEPGRPMINTTEWSSSEPADDVPMTVAELRASIHRVLGADVPIGEPEHPGPNLLRRLAGRNTRIAERFRAGRVFLVGDAAHVHSAMGGPGLNLGLQDVANLGWKLAAAVKGWAPDGLLDTYESERRPLAERVVMHSMAQSALVAPGPEVTALRELFEELLRDESTLRHVAETMAGSDVRYLSGDHPLVGRFLPDIPLADGRIAELMRSGRPVLLDFAGVDVPEGWRDRVDVVAVRSPAAPAGAVLVRPDGYVAWAGDDVHNGLPESLAMWFGTPKHMAVTP